MKKIKKKILSLFIVFTLIFNTHSTFILAEGIENNETNESTELSGEENESKEELDLEEEDGALDEENSVGEEGSKSEEESDEDLDWEEEEDKKENSDYEEEPEQDETEAKEEESVEETEIETEAEEKSSEESKEETLAEDESNEESKEETLAETEAKEETSGEVESESAEETNIENTGETTAEESTETTVEDSTETTAETEPVLETTELAPKDDVYNGNTLRVRVYYRPGNDGNGLMITDSYNFTVNDRTQPYNCSVTLRETGSFTAKDSSLSLVGWKDTNSGQYDFGHTYNITITTDQMWYFLDNSGDNYNYNVNLYALYGTQKKYTIKYNSNGGTGSMSNQTNRSTNTSYTLSTNTFTRDGYKFKGWATSSTGAVEYNDGASYKRGYASTTNNSTYNLYAVWEELKYTLHYDLQGGSGNIPDKEVRSGADEIITSVIPTREGYNFLGWHPMPGQLTAMYVGGDTFSMLVEENGVTQNLYAVWVQGKYYVNYNANGGTGDTIERSTGYNNVDLDLKANTYTKEHYKFIGWDEDQNATTPTYTGSVKFNKPVPMEEDGKEFTVYAIWKKINYTIHYDMNTGTGSIDDMIDLESGKNYTLSNTVPTKENYKFLGWAETNSATDATYAKGGSINKTLEPAQDGTTITLYAVWSKYTYVVKYNNNGGSGSIANSDGKSGEDLTLTTNTFTKTNYKFIGWSEDNTATTATYTDGGVFNKVIATEAEDGKEFTLYAVWQRIKYTIHYDMNTGTGSIDDMTDLESGTNYTLSDTLPTKENYKFLGWAETNSATDATYAKGGSINKTLEPDDDGTTITLYAVWTKYRFKVKYNNNGGSGSIEASDGKSGEDLTLTTNTFTKTNYKFIGWSEDNTATTATYTDGGVFNKVIATEAEDGKEFTLYAVWQRIKYKVVYDMNTGTGTIADLTDLESGTNYTLSDTVPTKENYKFLGWSESDSAENATYLKGGTINKVLDPSDDDKTFTLYAVWTKYRFKVKYNSNGGAGTLADSDGKSGEDLTLTSNTFTKTNYKFIGWSEDNAATTADYQDAGTFNKVIATEAEDGKEFTLYAVWQRVKYNVVYDMNTGTGTIADLTDLESGTNYTLSDTVPTKENYKFLGWAESNSAENATYLKGGTINKVLDPSDDDKTFTLYAVWTKYRFKVKYNSNGGSGNIANSDGKSGEDLTLTSNTFTKTNYKFIGWSEDNTATTADYQDAGTFNKVIATEADDGKQFTLYAVWNKYKYTLHYDIKDGTGVNISDEEIGSGDEIRLTTEVPQKDDYVFAGWSETDGGSAKYKKNGKFTHSVGDDNITVTLYAVYNKEYKQAGAQENKGGGGSGGGGGGGGGSSKIKEAGNGHSSIISYNFIPQEKLNDTKTEFVRTLLNGTNLNAIVYDRIHDVYGNTGYGSWLKDNTNDKWLYWAGDFERSNLRGSRGFVHSDWYRIRHKGIERWYNFDSDGYMRTGWYEEKGKIYYFNTNVNTPEYGSMVTGTQSIDGKTYLFSSEGVLIREY